jgi:hypothetical protein
VLLISSRRNHFAAIETSTTEATLEVMPIVGNIATLVPASGQSPLPARGPWALFCFGYWMYDPGAKIRQQTVGIVRCHDEVPRKAGATLDDNRAPKDAVAKTERGERSREISYREAPRRDTGNIVQRYRIDRNAIEEPDLEPCGR